MTQEICPAANGPNQLHRAVSRLDDSKVRRLLEQGDDPNQRDDTFGHTPLDMLVLGPPSKETFAIAELLASYGADVDAVGHHGMSPLFSAVLQGWTRWVEWLMNHGADPNLKTLDGTSAFDLAEGDDDEELVAMMKQILERRHLAQEIAEVPSRDVQRVRL